MTDKQINYEQNSVIIDGVDVSGCEFYNKVIGEDAYCNIDEEHLYTCISYNNCYYKQLKRKEQECEELKKQVDITQMFLDACNNSCEHYKQTLSEIKEIAEHCMKQDICTTCDYSDKCHIEDEYIPTYDVCKLILQKISEVKV